MNFILLIYLINAHIYFNKMLFLFCLQINLRLILVSGKTREFLFVHSDSAADITDYVYSNWPSGTCSLVHPLYSTGLDKQKNSA